MDFCMLLKAYYPKRTASQKNLLCAILYFFQENKVVIVYFSIVDRVKLNVKTLIKM